MRNSDENEATLVLASYNHAPYIPDALTSVAAQKGVRIQLIVTDDASTDDSVAVIERELSRLDLPATTIFHGRNRGICATFNEALARVETPFVAFLAADDWMEPQRFAQQVEALHRHSEAALVYSDMWIQGEGPAPRSRYSALWDDDWRGGDHENLFESLAHINWIPAPTVLSRTAALRAAGGYDENLPAEDHDMWLRLARNHEFVYLDQPLVTWRRVVNSLTSRLDDRSEDARRTAQIRMLRKHLGQDPLIDSWLEPRLFHLAVAELKAGTRGRDLRSLLRQCSRISPTTTRLRFAAAAHLPARRRSGRS